MFTRRYSCFGVRWNQPRSSRKSRRELGEFIKMMSEKNLKLNKKKAKFRMTEVNYMGQILTADGLKPDELKMTAIWNIQTPKIFKLCCRNSTISRMRKLSRKVSHTDLYEIWQAKTSVAMDWQRVKVIWWSKTTTNNPTEKLHHYIIGKDTHLETDQKPLVPWQIGIVWAVL